MRESLGEAELRGKRGMHRRFQNLYDAFPMSAEFSKFDSIRLLVSALFLETAGVVGLVVALPLRPPTHFSSDSAFGAALLLPINSRDCRLVVA